MECDEDEGASVLPPIDRLASYHPFRGRHDELRDVLRLSSGRTSTIRSWEVTYILFCSVLEKDRRNLAGKESLYFRKIHRHENNPFVLIH